MNEIVLWLQAEDDEVIVVATSNEKAVHQPVYIIEIYLPSGLVVYSTRDFKVANAA